MFDEVEVVPGPFDVVSFEEGCEGDGRQEAARERTAGQRTPSVAATPAMVLSTMKR